MSIFTLKISVKNQSIYSCGNVILTLKLLGIWMQYKQLAHESLQLTALRCCIDPLIITYSLTESHLLHQHTPTVSHTRTHQDTRSTRVLTTSFQCIKKNILGCSYNS